MQPPGHWNLFTQFVSQRDNLDLDTQVKLFFVLTNAVFDAGIACWETTGSDRFGASQIIKAGTAPFETGQVPATDITLSWATFSDAANQAGMSRRYGGIHFEEGDLMGRAMGREVAAVVWDKAQAYIHGNA